MNPQSFLEEVKKKKARKKQNRQEYRKQKDKFVDLNPSIQVITLNINDLNIPIKKEFVRLRKQGSPGKPNNKNLYAHKNTWSLQLKLQRFQTVGRFFAF